MALNKLELTGIKFLLSRIKSKSPKEYQLIVNISTAIAAICGLYILAFNSCNLSVYGAVYGQINAICIGLGAGFTMTGLVSSTTTTDPELLTKELTDNITAAQQNIQDLLKKN